jgi:plastocyanin
VTCTSGGSGTVSVVASYYGGFSPSLSNITVGQSVTWTNVDTGTYSYYHVITSNSDAFNPQRINPGQSVTCTFNVAGTYDYHCSVHPFMVGAVNVQP